MADTQTFVLPEEVTRAKQRAQELTGAAGQYAAGEPTISDVLQQKVTEAYSTNQDIIQKLDQAIGGYLPAPSVGREKYQNIWNPFQRESLVSQYVANQAVPMLTYSGLLGQRFGRIEDLIGAGTRGYQGMVMAKQAEAQQARQLYEDLLGEYTAEKNYELELYKATHPGGSGTNITISGVTIPGVTEPQTGKVTLTDPNTGQVFEYDSVNDPDYKADYAKWNMPGQPNPTPTPQPQQPNPTPPGTPISRYFNPIWKTPFPIQPLY